MIIIIEKSRGYYQLSFANIILFYRFAKKNAMKSLNFKDVVLDINERFEKFNELRINKNINNKLQNSNKTKSSDFVDKKSQVIDSKKIIDNNSKNIKANIEDNSVLITKTETQADNEKVYDFDYNSYGFTKKDDAVYDFDKFKPNLKIVSNDFIFDDSVENEIELLPKRELKDFIRKDDFFLTDEEKLRLENAKKKNQQKETKNFFKAITDFFADDDAKKQSKLNDINSNLEPDFSEELIQKTENLQNTIDANQSEKEIEVKTQKSQIIEDEIQLKVVKPEPVEKLLSDQKTINSKTENVDFRKNKRKK